MHLKSETASFLSNPKEFLKQRSVSRVVSYYSRSVPSNSQDS